MKRFVLPSVALLFGLVQGLRADSTLSFNEIMYHPAAGETTGEWVELRNLLAVDIDLSGWSIQGGVQYTFASNTIVKGGAFVVVAVAPDALRAATGLANVMGPLTGRLNNGGDILRVLNNSGRVVDEIQYGVDGDWPVGADGAGVSLAKRESESNSGAPASWTVSARVGGTPGAANFGVGLPGGLISYWNFNESAGPAAIDQVGQNAGTLGTGAARVTTPAVGRGLSFSGTTNAFVSLGAGTGGTLSPSNAITIEALLAPGWSGAGTNPAVIFRKGTAQPAAYRDTVLASRPLAYWRLADSTTAIQDATANAHAGTASAGVVLNQPSLIPSDPGNGAAKATGAERITIPGFEKIGPGGYTVEFWVKPGVLPTACCQNLVGDGDAASDFFLMNYILGSAQGTVGAIRPHFGPNNSPVSMDSPTALQVNNTYHIVTTWDPTSANNNAAIYINGVADRVGTISRTLPVAGTFGNNSVYIGHDQREGGDGTYTYDEVALYNYAIPASDVAAHYTAAVTTNFAVTLGNPILLAFQNDGNNGQATPPVAAGPVLSFGLTVGGTYSELDLPLDGLGGRPSLAGLEDGQLHHVAATYDRATGIKAIYVDGVLRSSTTLSGGIGVNPGAVAVIGNSEVNGAGAYTGGLDEVAFWGKALTAGEVSAHATAAAAGRDYFAPVQETAVALAFNELSPSTNGVFWVELANYGGTTLPLGGYALVRDGLVGNTYVFPAGASLAAGGFLSLSNSTLGFLPVAGDKLYLMPPARDRVIDSVVVNNGARARAVAGTGSWMIPTSPSPGGATVIVLRNEIVINEIMYNHQLIFPTNGTAPVESPESWIELYNRSSNAVNLTGWELGGGISYRFSSGQTLAPGAYLVVAGDAVTLRAAYPGIAIVGDLGGRLGGSGDTITLKDPNGNQADQVKYLSSAPWPGYASGGGSSLELVDPNADNTRPEAWAASDETGKVGWQTISYRQTGAIPSGSGQPTIWHEFVFGLLGAGECLIDDIRVLETPTGAAPTQLVPNGGFENGLTLWRVLGNHIQSRVEVDPDNAANHVLHLITTGPQEHMNNHLEITCVSNIAVVASKEYEVSYRVRWLAGNNLLNTRLYFNRVGRTTPLTVTTRTGTPGARNSRYSPNIGPTYKNLKHEPAVPQPGQPVTVSVVAEDPQGVGSAEVRWSVNGGAWSSGPMTHQGSGIYAGQVPASSAGAIVQFYVAATDSLGATSFYPARSTNAGALYQVADGQANLALGHNFRLILTPANRDLIHANTNVQSNDELPATVIYDESRPYYNVGVRLKGSEHGRYLDARVSFHVTFPADDPFRGVHSVMLFDRSGAGDTDSNKQEEILIRHMLLRAGNIPGTQPDLCRLIAPRSTHTGPAILSPRHEDEFLKTAFTNGSKGSMWEMDLIYVMVPTNQFGYKIAAPDQVVGTDVQNLGDDKEYYRYNFMLKNHRDGDDFRPFITMAKTFSVAPGLLLDEQTRQVMDMDEWTRTFALETLCGVGDSYTFGNPHNLFMYARPSDGKFLAFSVDMDFSFNRGAGSSLIGDQNLGTIFSRPVYKRMLYDHVKDIIATCFNTAYMAYWIPHYESFVPGQSYAARTTYITQRIAAANAEINTAGGTNAFNITSSSSVTTTTNMVVLSGTAPVGVRTIRVNGREFPITWTSVFAWTMRVPLSAPSTVLVAEGFDRNGNPVPNATRSVTATYTGPVQDPVGLVKFNEIMYNSQVPGASYVELYNNSDSAFDLSGWSINGLGYTFPEGSILVSRQYLVLAQDRGLHLATYPNSPVAPFAQFNGRLDPDGETLTLLKPGASGGPVVVVSEVRFESRLPWGPRANGQGTSLQVIDASKDISRPSNWTDREQWRFGSYTANIGLNDTNFLIYLTTLGDVYVDDVVLVTGAVAQAGQNLLANGGFEEPISTAWTVLGNHSNTVISTEFSHSGQASLHIFSSGVGSPASAIRQDFFPGLPSPTSCTVSYWFIPTTNANGMALRCRNGSTFNTQISVRPVVFTPGSANVVAAPLPAYDSLWLNELQAENVSGATDNFGQRDPWIEIYNGGESALDLSGYYLANNYDTNLTQWAFPAGSTIGAKQFKVLWADGEPQQTAGASLHTSFRLNSATGSVALVRRVDGKPQITDYLTYASLPPGRSYGDYPDGQPFSRQEFYKPTPGAANDNAALPLVVKINEWMAANSGSLVNTNHSNRYDDWFELYNPGPTVADLGGFFLTDGLSNKFKFQIPAGYSIPAGGHLLVWADNQPGLNSAGDPDLHVNFSLSQQGDEIGVFGSDGRLVDAVAFEPQFTDISQGRFPNGTGPQYFLASPTPRAANTSWANRYPELAPVADAQLVAGQVLTFTASGTDPDSPLQSLAYSLDAGAPLGAAINPLTGLFTWTAPNVAGTNVITVRVTDSGFPALSVGRSFLAVVSQGFRVGGISRLANGDLTFTVGVAAGKTYRVDYKTDLGAASWTQLSPPQVAGSGALTITDPAPASPQRFYRVVQLD